MPDPIRADRRKAEPEAIAVADSFVEKTSPGSITTPSLRAAAARWVALVPSGQETQ